MKSRNTNEEEVTQTNLADLCKLFGVTPHALIESIMGSPNARGYILGSLTEVLLKEEFEAHGFEVKRIKEKWVGPKLHHGDFYVSRDGKSWFIVESKGLKSNSERWHKIADVDPTPAKLEAWFRKKRSGEIKKWWDALPEKRRNLILKSAKFHEARVLETHFVSGTGGKAGRKIATPRKSEFHIVALDLFLRTGRHEFAYAASSELEGAEKSPEHLKQNYLIDIMLPEIDLSPTLPPPWTFDFDSLFNRLTNPIRQKDMQVDLRLRGLREAEESTLDEEEGPA